MYAFGEKAALEQCRRDAALVFSMTASVVMFTAMAVSRELPEYAVVVTEVKAVLDAFQEESADRASRKDPLKTTLKVRLQI